MSMTSAVDAVLRAGLPGLFGGSPPPVVLDVARAAVCAETMPSDVDAEPRRVAGDVVVRTRLHVAETVHIGLSGVDGSDLERAEVLVLAVLVLAGRRITEASGDEYLDGDYGATVLTEGLDVRGSTDQDGGRRIEVRVRREITATRVLRDDEGQPITRIHGPGTPRPGRPVDVPVEIEA